MYLASNIPTRQILLGLRILLLYVVEEFEKACINAEVKKLRKSPKENKRKISFSYLWFTLIHVEKSATFIPLRGFLEKHSYLILNQNGKNVHRPVFVPERLKSPIFGGTIYLYNLFITGSPSQLLRRLSVNVVKSNHRW